MKQKYVASGDISREFERKEYLYTMIIFDCIKFYFDFALSGLSMPPLNKSSLDFFKYTLSKKKTRSVKTIWYVDFIC